jgi:uncharacterized protein (DUF433 family)
MTTLDWSQCPAVESVPGKVSGAWVFKDTRMPVATVFENLEAGLTVEEVMEEFSVTREQINAVLRFAAKSLITPFPLSAPANARRCSSLWRWHVSDYFRKLAPISPGSSRALTTSVVFQRFGKCRLLPVTR